MNITQFVIVFIISWLIVAFWFIAPRAAVENERPRERVVVSVTTDKGDGAVVIYPPQGLTLRELGEVINAAAEKLEKGEK